MKYILPRPGSSRHHHLLVACMPKSGSSYLTAILRSLPGMTALSLVPGYDRREQELDVGMLRAADGIDYVAHHHVRYSMPTRTLLNHFNVRPIVQVRNIFDVVVSLRDHLRNESLEGSMGYVVPGMELWEDELLERFIVTMMIPWYFNFFMSWNACESKLLVRYEELISDPERVVSEICKYASISLESGQVNRAIDAAGVAFTRKNKGIPGRGLALSDQLRNQIREMGAYYRDADFSAIGL